MIINGGDVVRLERKRQPNAGAVRMTESPRHHSDHGVLSAVNYERASQNVSSSVHRLTPEIVTDNHDGRSFVPTLVSIKVPALHRRQPENGKKVGGYTRRRNSFSGRGIVETDYRYAACACADVFKNIAAEFL